jgi:hypothetical protein
MMSTGVAVVLSALLAVPHTASAAPVPTDGLVSLWDFQEASGPFVAKLGSGHYALEATDFDANTHTWSPGAVERVHDAPPGQPFGPLSASISLAQMLEVPETFELAPLLNIHGDNATLTVVAWLKPSSYYANSSHRPDFGHVAGIWSEAINVRTYVMFCPSSSRGGEKPWNVSHLDAEISRTGGTMQPACRWSTSYALGSAAIVPGAWHMTAMTFDGEFIRAYVNGSLDFRAPHRLNPPESMCNETWQNPASVRTWSNRSSWGPGGDPLSENTTNFAVGGQGAPSSGLGHSWVGQMGGLAVYDRALDPEELLAMAERTGMA